jgi:hypothetical protein
MIGDQFCAEKEPPRRPQGAAAAPMLPCPQPIPFGVTEVEAQFFQDPRKIPFRQLE